MPNKNQKFVEKFLICTFVAENMKYCLLLIGVATLITLAKCDIHEAFEVCQEKYDIQKEYLIKVAKKIEVANKNMKCFMHCIWKVIGLLDDKGKYNIESHWIQRYSEKDKNEIKACKDIHDGEQQECEYAFKMIGCMKDRIKLELERD